MTTKILLRSAFGLAIIATLAGCGNLTNIHRTNQSANEVDNESQKAIQAAQNVSQRSHVEIVYDQVWVNPTATVRAAPEDPALDCPLTFAPKPSATLDQLADAITTTCGIGVRVTSDAQQALAGLLDQRPMQGSQNNVVSSVGTSTTGLPGGFTPPALSGANNSFGNGNPNAYGATRTTKITETFDHAKLRNVLDGALGQLSLSYRYDRERKLITVYYFETKTFQIKTIPGENSIANDVEAGNSVQQGVSQGGTSGSSGSGGGSSGTTSTTTSTVTKVTSNVLTELQSALNNMCSHPNCAVVTPSTSSVTVTDTPDVVAKIGEYMDQQNAVLYAQLTLHLKVLLFTSTDGADAGLNIDAAFQAASKKFGAVLQTAYTPLTGASTLTTNILSGNKQWSGSQAIVSALQQMGKVTTVYDNTMTIANLHPTPINTYLNTPFISSNLTSQVANAGNLSSSQTSTATTGFFLTIYPNILEDGREVLLKVSQSISVLDGIKTLASGSTPQQGAQTEGNTLDQLAHCKSGETIVMTGFQSTALTVNGQGGLAGGGFNTNNKRQTIVVIATPVVD